MKRFRLSYLLILPALMMLASCQGNDELTEQGGGLQPEKDGSVWIHLNVSSANSSKTRADEWKDNENAADAEMMNVWTVVAVSTTDKKVKGIFACKPSKKPDREIDDLVHLPEAGTYRFYSFANMSPKVVMNILGIPGSGTPTTRADAGTSYNTSASNAPTSGGNNNPDREENTALDNGQMAANGVDGTETTAYTFVTDDNYAKDTYYDIAFEAKELTAETVENIAVNVAGNNFNIGASDNLFGATGIPMSNVQTITVENNSNVDLIVIRMMAKIELQIYNDKGSDVTVESFMLTDLNKNQNNNLKLLPSLTSGANTMEYVHGDLQPNLGSSTSTGNMTLYPTSATISATTNSTKAGTPVKFTFYVNESAKPTNEFKHFFLKIKLQGETEQRYVLIDDKGSTTDDDNKWDYIARNDYRIIPIVLDDYKLDIIPYDFPAIGVYPASVKEEDGLYTINFHDYGHFHLLPVVKKMSNNSVVPFTATTPDYSSTTWGLVNNTFSESWGTWTDATKETTGDGSFYRSGYSVTPPVDGDEVGGFPVWYVNDGTNGPQWAPDATNYRPFIFGYIADPGTTLSDDKKVYHEFSIYLYKQGMSAPRQMTYRLLMILDKEQMSYARQRYGRTTRRTHH